VGKIKNTNQLLFWEDFARHLYGFDRSLCNKIRKKNEISNLFVNYFSN